MKLLFQENSLNLRGTSIAVYDYAFYLQQTYNYECIITFNQNDPNTNEHVLKKFKRNFAIIPHTCLADLERIIDNEQIDVMYSIKSGHRDHIVTDKTKTCVHAVFPNNPLEKHGDVYAYVSKWLSDHCSKGTIPYVPHMVNLPECDDDYRRQLNISPDSIVFGRYGGYETFDIPFVHQAIKQILDQTNNIYFLFCNTHCFVNHPRAIFTSNTASLQEKVKFINTCDAFIHARYRGETFGLSVLEFMSKNKPIFTFGQSDEKHHYSLLDGQGIVYNNYEELFELIRKFVPNKILYKQLHNFLPQTVTNQFCNIFLK
jgi:hypothetical protein